MAIVPIGDKTMYANHITLNRQQDHKIEQAMYVSLNRQQTREVKTKYANVLRRLHTCRPCEKAGLKMLLDYYYNLLN